MFLPYITILSTMVDKSKNFKHALHYWAMSDFECSRVDINFFGLRYFMIIYGLILNVTGSFINLIFL